MNILLMQPLEFERAVNTIVIVLLCVLLVAVIGVSVYLLVRMRRKVDGLMKTIETISAELRDKSGKMDDLVGSAEIDSVSEDIKNDGQNDSGSLHEEGGLALQSLLFKINNMYESYYRHGETETGKKNMIGSVQDILSYLRSREFLENLEKAIDRETNGLLKEFYNAVGNVQEKRRRLLVFTYYNLSAETICLVLELTPNALYKRRGRLREVIEISGFPRSQELLKRIFHQK